MDYGHKLTEKELEELEKRISKEYETAEKEVQDKLFDYLQNFQRKDADMQAQKEAGKISQTEYNNWRVNQMATGKRWEDMRNSLAEDFHNANNIAKEMVKEHSYDIYALNHNYGTYEIEKGLGIDTSYTLYDRATVERLVRDNPQMLPPPGKKVSERIKAGLDVRWNNQQIQSVMMQGLLQGMSMPDLAKRLAETVGDKDKVGAMRNARTMTTGAQNAGRVDSYKRAVDMGIKTKERWIAVLDEKTRHSHRQLDGEMVEVGEKFSNGLRYPGEPGGAPEEVYNCRCRIVSAIEGTALAGNIEDFPRLSKIDNYEDWKKGKEPEKKPEIEIHEVKTINPEIFKDSNTINGGYAYELAKDSNYVNERNKEEHLFLLEKDGNTAFAYIWEDEKELEITTIGSTGGGLGTDMFMGMMERTLEKDLDMTWMADRKSAQEYYSHLDLDKYIDKKYSDNKVTRYVIPLENLQTEIEKIKRRR